MSINDIKVSLIIPIYNVEKYLDKCMETVINQTHENLEIIMVDDGSTDNSGYIADKYASCDNRIIVIHKENEKVSMARNTGINIATGEYICFADADDYLEPNYVEYLLNLAVDNDADIALTTEMFTTFHKNQVKEKGVVTRTPEEALEDILTYKLPIGVYCKIFRRRLLDDNIRFTPNIYIGEGFNFNVDAFQNANKIIEGNRRVYFYRRDNPTSATTKFNIDKWENALYAIDQIFNKLKFHSDRIENAWNYAQWHTYCDSFNFLVLSKEGSQHPDAYEEWKNIIQKKATCAFKVPISHREKIRALITILNPRIIPWLIGIRNNIYIK